MKRMFRWPTGKFTKLNQASKSEKRGAKKLVGAVQACFEQLELRQMLTAVTANPGGPYTTNEGTFVHIAGSQIGATTPQYKWDLNYDGSHFVTQATGQAFNYTPPDGPKSQTIALRVVDQANPSNMDTETTTLTVNNVAPTINLSGASTVNTGDSYTLSWTHSDPGQDTISNWSIDWGDDSDPTSVSGTATSATHVYSDASTPTITVTATDEDNSYQVTKNITVTPVTPVVTISSDSAVDQGSLYTLNFSATNSNIVNGYSIDWGDGNNDFVDSTGSSDTHTYMDPGTYTIEVDANTDDTTGSQTLDLTVNDVAPTVGITGTPQTSQAEGTSESFDSTVTDPGADDTFTYSWTLFKDGQAYSLPGNVQTDQHDFNFTLPDNGTYYTELTVADNFGASTTVDSDTFTGTNVAPSVSISGEPGSNIDEGTEVDLTATATDPGANENLTYSWSVTKDGNYYTLLDSVATDQSALSFTPGHSGAYIATVVVADKDGAQVSKDSQTINVDNVAPTGSISGEPGSSIGEGTPVSLSVSASDAGADDTLTYAWTVTRNGNPYTLPDSVATDGTTLDFTPDNQGTWVATCTVTDDDGAATPIASQNITVTNVAPTGTISGEPDGSINEGDTVQLHVDTTDPGIHDTIASYSWSVTQDGNPLTLPNGTITDEADFTFAVPDNGTYVASCVVTDNDGGSSTATSQTITALNVAPTVGIDGLPADSVDEGTEIDLTANISDPGVNDTVASYAWSVTKDNDPFTLPNGADVSDPAFSFTPTDNGSYVVTLTAVDNDGGSKTFNSPAITVDNVDPTVSITGQPGSDINEGDQISLTATPSDVSSVDTDAGFTYAWTVTLNGQPLTLPDSVSLDGADLTFTTPTFGDYDASVQVEDKDGGAGTSDSNTITADDVAPTGTISGEPGSDINEGDTVQLSVAASDAGSADNITYSWSVTKDGDPYTLPDTVTTDEADFSFVPDHSGDYVATVELSDGTLTNDVPSQTITADDVAPSGTITGAPTTSPEGTAIPLSVTASDPGTADTLSYSWAVTKDGDPFILPGGTDTSSANFTFTPTDNGTYVATVTIDDGDGGTTPVSTDPISVTNVAPVGTIHGAPAHSPEGTAIPLTSTVADPGSLDTFTYAWSVTKDGNAFTLPNGTDTASSGFTFTPTDNGAYVVSLTVTDNDGDHTTSTANITVDNVAPTGSIQTEPSGPNSEGDTLFYGASVTDPGTSDTFTYAWSVTKDGNYYTLPDIVVTNAPTFQFDAADPGVYKASVVVTDNDGGVSNTATSDALTVQNAAPVPSIDTEPESPLDEGSTLTFTGSANDPGVNDTETFAWTVTKDGDPFTLPDSVTTNTSTLSFVAPDNGTYAAHLTVTDNGGLSGTVDSDDITVNNVAPTASITGMPEGGQSDEGTQISLGADVVDPGSLDTFTYAWSVTKDGNSFATGTSSTFNFTPDDQGSYEVDLVVTDNDGDASQMATQTLTVNNVPQTVDMSMAPTTANEGDEISFPIDVTDPSTADTDAGFDIAWHVVKNGSDAFFASGTDTEVQFTPDDNGTYVVDVMTTDKDDVEVAGSATVTVANVAPDASITNAPSTITEGSSITLGSSVTDPGTADVTAGFTYAWSVKKDNVTFTLPDDAVTNTSSFTFTPTDNGSYVVKLVVTDKDGDSVTKTKTIAVTNVAPTASITGAPTTSVEGTAISLGSSVTDPGSLDTFTYAWSVKKNGNAFGNGGTSQNFSFTPDDNGTYVVSLTVTDKDGGASSPATKTITVTNANPSATVSVPFTGVSNQATTVNLSVNDAGTADTETIVWNWGDGSAADTLSSAASASLSRTHAYAAAGTYPITVSVTDDDGGTAQTSTTVTVKSVAVQADPFNSSKTALVVDGTAASDVIRFSLNSNGRIKLTENGVLVGTYAAPTGHIIAYGEGGNNIITVDNGITTDAILYGGSGKDILTGGSGDDVLVGRRGSDALFGGDGRDILIGGVGLDAEDGGRGEDLIIGGSHAMAEDFNAMSLIDAEWLRTDAPLATRIKHLNGTATGGLNGSQRLTSSTVTEDVDDVMLGGTDSGNWFFTNGKVADYNAKLGDVVTAASLGLTSTAPKKTK